MSVEATSKFLLRNTKKGLFVKLKNGLYALAEDLPNEYFIANRLYQPSYISFDSALSFHKVIPETIYAVTSATTKPRRQFVVNNISYTYNKVKKTVFVGYKSIKHQGETIFMAEPEKALVDYLYFISLKKRELHYERLDLKKVKKTKAIKYAKVFKRRALTELVGEIYAKFGEH